MSAPIHFFRDDALGNADAVTLARLLKRREVSPLELANAAKERAKAAQTSLHLITDMGLDNTSSFDENSHLQFSGIPTFIKDNLQVKGFSTTFGSAAITLPKAKQHDPYAKQFVDLGFKVLGKSSLPEFGLNATTEPVHQEPTLNPWNPDYSPGASSGGAAALVASGVVPIAHGNDGGGSIRIPAAACGLVGLKPSRGRHINSLAAKALPINIVSEGVLSRSVRDTAYFHFEAERLYHNNQLPSLPLVTSPGKQRFTIGLILDSVTGAPTDPETRQALVEVAQTLGELGHNIIEIPCPVGSDFIDDFVHYWAMMAYVLRSTGNIAFGKRFNAQKLDRFTKGLSSYYRSRILRTPKTLLNLRKHAHQIKNAFEEVDLILSPVTSHVTPPLGHLSPSTTFDILFERLKAYVGFTPLANTAGTPAIALPAGINKQGLPLSVQVMANIGGEKELLEIAYALEEARPWQQLYQFSNTQAH